MPQIDAIGPFRALHWPIVDGKGDSIALPQRRYLGPALHARALLGQHELAAAKVASRLRKQDRHLDRKGEIPIEILMQAIEIARAILQQQRRRPALTRLVT